VLAQVLPSLSHAKSDALVMFAGGAGGLWLFLCYALLCVAYALLFLAAGIQLHNGRPSRLSDQAAGSGPACCTTLNLACLAWQQRAWQQRAGGERFTTIWQLFVRVSCWV
jgi:hypothetical protein